MKIERNGNVYELTRAELRAAYEEQDRQFVIDDFVDEGKCIYEAAGKKEAYPEELMKSLADEWADYIIEKLEENDDSSDYYTALISECVIDALQENGIDPDTMEEEEEEE